MTSSSTSSGPGAWSGSSTPTTSMERRLIAIECEVLAPAALERSIRMDNAERVRANLVLEIANHPVTPEADALLHDRVWVVPDILGVRAA